MRSRLHINQTLGSIGTAAVVTDPVVFDPSPQTASLASLVRDMQAGAVKLLVILGANPVFTAPADLNFAQALQKVATRVHVGLFDDETAALCHWHVPSTHFLEEWSDARAHDGTASIVQPLIAPLYQGRSFHDVLVALSARPDRKGLDVVKQFWQTQPQAANVDFEKFWRRSLHDGVIAGSAAAPKTIGAVPPVPAAPPADATRGYEVIFAPDQTLYDGRFANNGWMQELPKPLTKITWDTAVLLSPATAAKLNVTSEDVIEIRVRNRTLSAPVWVQPGHAADAVTVFFGNGRARAGRVGTGIGYNGYAIRTSDAPWFVSGADIRKTGETVLIASTQGHHSMEGRAIVRSASLEHYKHEPEFAHHLEETPPKTLTLYADHKYEGYAWGMAIDQTVCTGCTACVVACVAENNIPVLGKEQVLRSREMHWIRIDRYFEGDPERPDIHHQPMLCQQCENAPCEVVCPVAATVHSSEGLNDMVYNRCVGTRYCSNNCPYKVRRFNFLLYAGLVHAEPEAAAQSRRHGAQPRRHGEVHLLRAADQPRASGRQGRGAQHPRRRHRHRVPAGVPDRGDRVRQHQRSREPGVEAARRGAQLRRAGRSQHAATDDVPGRDQEPERRRCGPRSRDTKVPSPRCRRRRPCGPRKKTA